jgi:hypothetical protein
MYLLFGRLWNGKIKKITGPAYGAMYGKPALLFSMLTNIFFRVDSNQSCDLLAIYRSCHFSRRNSEQSEFANKRFTVSVDLLEMLTLAVHICILL